MSATTKRTATPAGAFLSVHSCAISYASTRQRWLCNSNAKYMTLKDISLTFTDYTADKMTGILMPASKSTRSVQ
jgi:hypothetical protein